MALVSPIPTGGLQGILQNVGMLFSLIRRQQPSRVIRPNPQRSGENRTGVRKPIREPQLLFRGSIAGGSQGLLRGQTAVKNNQQSTIQRILSRQ